MVNFDKLGSRSGQDNYPTINQPWEEIPEKKRKVIKTLINHPEKTQNQIAEISGVDGSHVHNVIYSLPPEKFNEYQADVIQEAEVQVQPQEYELNEDDTVTVSAPMTMQVDITIPRNDLSTAVVAAMRDAVTDKNKIEPE